MENLGLPPARAPTPYGGHRGSAAATALNPGLGSFFDASRNTSE